jgi:cell division protein FtsB
LYVGCYINIPAILKWGWSFLTPGQEYIEIIYILSSLTAFSSCLYLSIKILKGIEAHFDKIKKERKELQDQIEELERENNEMKNTFRLMVSYANPNVMERNKVKQIKN